MSGLNFNPLAFALTKIQGIGLSHQRAIRPSILLSLMRVFGIALALYAGASKGQTGAVGEPYEVTYFCNMVRLEWPDSDSSNFNFNILDIRLDEKLTELPYAISIQLKSLNRRETISWELANGGQLANSSVLIRPEEGATSAIMDLSNLQSLTNSPLLRLACFKGRTPFPAIEAARYGIVITINIECRTTTMNEQRTIQFELTEANFPVELEPNTQEQAPKTLIIFDMNGHAVATFNSGNTDGEREALIGLPNGLYFIVDPSTEDRLPTRKVRKS